MAGVIGLVVGFSIPKVYTVSSKLAPEIVSRTNSSLSSLASIAGVNLNNMSTSDAVYPELYPEIVSSTPFVVELFSIPVEIETRKEGYGPHRPLHLPARLHAQPLVERGLLRTLQGSWLADGPCQRR